MLLAQISATNEVLIGSQVSGTISAVFVEENDAVKKGDILAVINPDTINQTIARYEAQLNSAKHHLMPLSPPALSHPLPASACSAGSSAASSAAGPDYP